MADRISNLSSELIGQILTYLPFNQAVRTSVLSRKWRYKWTKIPYLHFDSRLNLVLDGEHNLESIIDHALLHHNGVLTKFSLKLFDRKIYPINVWLLILLLNPIEELKLRFSKLCSCRVMPDDLFQFSHLKDLYINFCEIKLPPAFQGFSNLVRLKLLNLKIELGELITLLSRCSKLEAVELKFLQIDGWQNELPREFNQVPLLKLHSIDVRRVDYATAVLSLLRSSPGLKRLELKCNMRGIASDDNSSVAYLDAQLFSALSKQNAPFCNLLNHLEIENMGVCAEMIKLVKVVMLWAPSLKAIVLCGNRDDIYM